MRHPELNPRRIYSRAVTPELFDDTALAPLKKIFEDDFKDVGLSQEESEEKADNLTHQSGDDLTPEQKNRLHIVHTLSADKEIDPVNVIGYSIIGREKYGDLVPYQAKLRTKIGAAVYKIENLLRIDEQLRTNHLFLIAHVLVSTNTEEYSLVFRNLFDEVARLPNARYLDVVTFDVDTPRNSAMIGGLHLAARGSLRRKTQVHDVEGPRRTLNSVKLSEAL